MACLFAFLIVVLEVEVFLIVLNRFNSLIVFNNFEYVYFSFKNFLSFRCFKKLLLNLIASS